MLGLSFADLAKLASGKPSHDEELLSEDQELSLAAEPKLLAFLYLLINDWSRDDIVREYKISAAEADRFLLRLDKEKLIELHPRGRVRILCGRNLTWRANGPIAKLYERLVKTEFLDCDFATKDQSFRFATGEVSVASIRLLQRKIADLIQTWHSCAEVDATLPKADTKSVGLLIAMRPWIFSVFEHLKRHN